ncbi:hypothetical protein RRG08_057478 [Elysia crispata]|uniref:Integrase SAM-like N-terminal domain-containing protein n=1 Tax=Elysia crispata TaxID=231223 RepID=A0AAE0XXN4_9GAST|nr:hypothetical protein RRG08_057478 [Elysia crispata]
MNSWCKKTRTQYNTYLKRYEAFCQRHGSDPLTPTETITVDFLTHMFNCGYGYSAINTARAAVAPEKSGSGSYTFLEHFHSAAVVYLPLTQLPMGNATVVEI